MPPHNSRVNKSSPPPQVKNGDILDVDEAAILLKVSRKTVYNRVKAGILPHDPVGRKLLFNRQKLSQWIALGGDVAGTIVGNESSSLEQFAQKLWHRVELCAAVQVPSR